MLKSLLLGLCFCLFAALAGAKTTKNTFLVALDEEPSWRDMAYLATVPASEKANSSGASLIGLGPDREVGVEMQDYLRRYKPEAVWVLGGEVSNPAALTESAEKKPQVNQLEVATAEESALKLSKTFWQSSKRVVICRHDDYSSALLAAPLATLLKAPLLYAGDSGLSPETDAEIKRLGAVRKFSLGADLSIDGAIKLDGAEEVMKWLKQKGMDVTYIAAVNPLDRAQTKLRKLSMIGAQLAAGRKGIVAPLPFQVEWKKPFKSAEPNQELPQRFQDEKIKARTGTLVAGSVQVPYVLTSKPDGSDHELFFHPEDSTKTKGPIRCGDMVELDGRKWTVSLGIGSSYHDADVHITWPGVDVVKAQLDTYYGIIGKPPVHLCLVGLPDAIPQGLVGSESISPDIATDLPYATLEDGQSSRIGVGRLVAEHVSFAALYAARVLTYQELLDKEWVQRASQAEWENTFGELFENVGYDASYRWTEEELDYVEPPSNGSKGRRAPSFNQDSLLARSGVLAHSNHSWNFELGSMMKWDASVLLAPALVESGGCGTTSLDRSAPGQAITEGATGAESPELAFKHRSVVSRLFRLGAVGFSGGSREMMAEYSPARQEFWNGILAGKSLGAAHQQAQNMGYLILKEKEPKGGSYAYWHSLQASSLLGDPALTIRLPGGARTAPAKTELSGQRLIVHAPEKWSVVKMFVPPDWKKWANRDLFVARGAGAYSLNTWGPEERDVETPMVKAEFESPGKIKSIVLKDQVKSPLGWSGIWHTKVNRDGTYTHRFGVQMLDLDQETGKIKQSVDRLEFAVEFE